MDLWLLFFAGIIIGWIISEKFYSRNNNQDISKDYLRGLNYVINEQQDKAISVFTKMLATNPETVETQIALGTLFRRRGESTRAINIHKNMIEGNNLSNSQKKEALLELGRDYMKAGMLDRAIEPFEELLRSNEHKKDALLFLSQIYDQEKDWDKAAKVVDKLYKLSKNDKWKVVRSHYFCEQAKIKIAEEKYDEADILLKKSLKQNPVCVRANFIKAKFLQKQNKHKAALKIFKQIEQQRPVQIPEILKPMLESYHKVADNKEIINYMKDLLSRNPSTSLLISLVDRIKSSEGLEKAEQVLVDALKSRPSVRGLELLISYSLDKEKNKENKANLQSLQLMMSKLQEEKPTYKCCHCGFEAQKLHWQCPGCRNWSTIEPIVGVSGE